jgi:uncharacterized protein YkwD
VPTRLASALALVLIAAPLLGAGSVAAASGPTIAEVQTAEARVETLVNRRRESRGKRPLRLDSRLSALARAKSQDMVDRGYFDHRDRQGHYADWHLRRADVQFSRVGEIIAWGRGEDIVSSANEAIDLWMHSTLHREQILKGNNYFGAGVASDGRTWKWTVMFITAPDHTDPRARFTSATVEGTTVDLRWTGSDPVLVTGTAGLRGFDLERRVPGGEWKRLRNVTLNRSYVREHSPGRTFEFRLRARDKQGNISRWTEPITLTIP